MAKRKGTTKPKRQPPARSATSFEVAAAAADDLAASMTCTSLFVSPVQRQVLPPAFGDLLRMRGLDVHGPVAAANFPTGPSFSPTDSFAVPDLQNTWNRGARLKVRFLDRQPDFRAQVETYVKEWEAAADLRFEFVSSGSAEIRISFARRGAFHSLLGREGLRAPPSELTMSLGFEPRETRPDAFRRLILHEFGHALGLMHEHQNPVGGGIQWNWPAAIAYYRARLPAGMPTEHIVAQLSAVPNSSRYRPTPFDPESIMLYQIPRELVLSGWKPEWDKNNTQLSATDKDTAREIYGPPPGGPTLPPATPTVQRLQVNGSSIEDSITVPGEVDRFVFDVGTEGVYQAEADGDVLVRVTLADASGSPLAGYMPADSLTTGQGARLPFYVSAGTYTLLVGASAFLPGSSGRYRVRVASR